MSNLHPIFQGLFTRAVRTVDMPPEPYDHLHGRHCSCVEETRRPRLAYHAAVEYAPDPDMDRLMLRLSIQHGRNLLAGCSTSTENSYEGVEVEL